MNLYQQLIEYVLALLLILLLSGCGAFERKVEYVPYEVRVPVEVPCAAQIPPEPAWATENMPYVNPLTGEGLPEAVDKLIAELWQRRGYEAQLLAAVEGCR